MSYRRTYSKIDNAPQARAESSLGMIVVINNLEIGRVQGLRTQFDRSPRPVTEIGSDGIVEFVPGVTRYNGSLQFLTIKYGDVVKRLASVTGTPINPESKSITLADMPEFDIMVFRRGAQSARQNEAQLYAPLGVRAFIPGRGAVVRHLVGCIIASGDQSISVNDSTIMESVNILYIDDIYDPDVEGAGAQELI